MRFGLLKPETPARARRGSFLAGTFLRSASGLSVHVASRTNVSLWLTRFDRPLCLSWLGDIARPTRLRAINPIFSWLLLNVGHQRAFFRAAGLRGMDLFGPSVAFDVA